MTGFIVILIVVIVLIIVRMGASKRNVVPNSTQTASQNTAQSNSTSSTPMFLNARKTALYNKCKQIISDNELQDKPSCQKDILDVLKAAFETSDDSVFPTSPEEIEMRAYILLAHTTFDLLSCGKYHMYRGVLNPNSPAKNLKQVYRAAMKYALEKGEIDKDTLVDQENFLNERIAEVG